MFLKLSPPPNPLPLFRLRFPSWWSLEHGACNTFPEVGQGGEGMGGYWYLSLPEKDDEYLSGSRGRKEFLPINRNMDADEKQMFFLCFSRKNRWARAMQWSYAWKGWIFNCWREKPSWAGFLTAVVVIIHFSLYKRITPCFITAVLSDDIISFGFAC